MILPTTSVSTLTRKPREVFSNKTPYTIVVSHSDPKGVILKPDIFEKISKTEIWNEICEEWGEAHDEETVNIVKKGKKMMKDGNYDNEIEFK